MIKGIFEKFDIVFAGKYKDDIDDILRLFKNKIPDSERMEYDGQSDTYIRHLLADVNDYNELIGYLNDNLDIEVGIVK